MTLPLTKVIAFPSDLQKLSSERLLEAYRTMVGIRRFEEKAAQLYAIGEIATLPPLSIGHEAILAAAALCLSPGEHMTSLSNSTGLSLADGADAARLMEHLLDGSFTSMSRGITDAAVVVADPSVASADLMSAITTSKFDGTPKVFVVINATTDVCDTVSLRTDQSALMREVAAIDLVGEVTDGTDLERVRQSIEAALDRSRHDHRPTVIEAMVYRYRGHARIGAHVKPSRPREDIDPLARTRAQLMGLGDTMAAHVVATEQSVRDAMNSAATQARSLEPVTRARL
jgi:TPP-dependent pyruvate/acetoin dehydrogenase alpha subunit